MSKISAYKELLNKRIKVICTDGDVLTGEWIDWTSEWDNEPDPESITIHEDGGGYVEIYIDEIKDITAVEE
ncbi:MAG: hypothetical protein ACOYBV_07630 [Candidatus Avilachnospira sp.]|jgi:hypothetical protein